MMPAWPVVALAAVNSDLVQRRNQPVTATQEIEGVKIGLPFAVTHKVSENVAEVDQQNACHGYRQQDRCPGDVFELHIAYDGKPQIAIQNGIKDQIKGSVGEHDEAQKEYEVKEQVIFLDVADFMGHDSVDLIIIQDPKQAFSYKDVTKGLDQSHDAGGQQFAFKDWPLQNIIVFQPGLFADGLNPATLWALWQGATSPEKLDQGGGDNDQGGQKRRKENDLPFWRGEQAFGGGKW